MYYVYALKSLTDSNWLYIGYSTDLKSRLIRHTRGLVRSTRAKLPLKLVYYEAYLSLKDARRREVELKRKGPLKEELKRRLENSLN